MRVSACPMGLDAHVRVVLQRPARDVAGDLLDDVIGLALLGSIAAQA
jgi:hypothetical protein